MRYCFVWETGEIYDFSGPGWQFVGHADEIAKQANARVEKLNLTKEEEREYWILPLTKKMEFIERQEKNDENN